MAADRLAAAGVLLAAVSNGVNVANLAPVTRPLADDLDVGFGALGVATTLLLLSHTAVQLVVGPLVDRIGPTALGRAALLACAAGNVALALAASLELVLGLRLLVGIGTGTVFIAALEAARYTGGRPLIGLFGGAITLGSAIVLVAGPPLAGVSWRAVFLATAVVALLAAAAFPRVSAPAAGGPRDLALSVRGSPVLRRLAVMHAATFGSSLVAGVWLLPMLVERATVGEAAAGVLAGVALLATSVARPLGAAWPGSWRSLRWATAAALAVGSGLVLGPWPVAVAGVLILGVGFAAPFARLYELGAAAHGGQTAAASAFLSAAGSAAALAVMPFVGADVEGGGGLLSLAGLAALGVLAAAVAGVDEPHRRPLPSARLERT